MNRIRISDVTMKQNGDSRDFCLSFREKLELAKQLDRLGVDVIELEPLCQGRSDTLRIKSAATAVQTSVLAVPVALNTQSVSETWAALKEAKHPRLQVPAPLSPMQMEYLLHKKPKALLAALDETIRACKALCTDVEFVADDATRSDEELLYAAIQTAIAAGASTVTVCDTAGTMLPGEFAAFLQKLLTAVPALSTVQLGVSCSDQLALADACVIAALSCGIQEIKAAAYPLQTASLANVAGVLAHRGRDLGLSTQIKTTQLQRGIHQIRALCQDGKERNSPFQSGVREEDGSWILTSNDSPEAVLNAARHLGYELSGEDEKKVCEAFARIAAKKEQVGSKELDAIIAAAAMQVPPTYKLENYLVTTGSAISATAHLRLLRNGQLQEGVCIGDGPIDAAFLAIEQITGHHYELDDFQIQAVTEGREAMGQSVVRLRADGKLYSGRGISTDIVASGIHAYLNALNKIVYEEGEA